MSHLTMLIILGFTILISCGLYLLLDGAPGDAWRG